MKTLWIALAISLFIVSNLFAQEAKKDASSGQVDVEVSSEVKDLAQELNLGSEEDLMVMIKKVNPELIKSIQEKNITINDKQAEQLKQLAMQHKSELVIAALTGKVPDKLFKKAEAIVPELKEIKPEEKEAIFKETRKAVNKTIFESMVDAEAQIGYLAGDVSSGVATQVNAKLLNVRTLTFGDITISNVHAEVNVGYPVNGLLLVSGDVKLKKDSDFTFHGKLLGLQHDLREHALDFMILQGGAKYAITKDIFVDGNIALGARTYDGFYIDPSLGIHAEQMAGPVRFKEYVTVKPQINTGRNFNFQASCGVRADVTIVNKDFLKLGAGIVSEFEANTSPAPHQNHYQWYNGISIQGKF
jgi:hypothetical protein